MPDENRIFDVTKPNRVSPSATSRPVIVGHRPELSDPMVKEQMAATGGGTKIMVNAPAAANNSLTGIEPAGPPPDFKEPAIIHETSTLMTPEDPVQPPAAEPSSMTNPKPSPTPLPTLPDEPEPSAAAAGSMPRVEELHFSAPRRRHKWPWILLAILILLIGAYLIIDSGLINTNINLPFHVFKQNTNNPPPANNSAASNSSAPAVPAGFSKYRLTGTSLTFAAPTSWGNPTSTAVPGFSQRGGTNQSDGTYAYLVDFATNKDVELAVTSGKYLPAKGPTPYYGYLQWCIGTNDNKIYESQLQFTTDPKTGVDTPTTVTCDQGPVPDATKIDSTTIVQSKAQDTSGKTIGDIYTKNLTDTSLSVFRVRDAAMTNGDAIKQLLGTVQLSSTGSSQ